MKISRLSKVAYLRSHARAGIIHHKKRFSFNWKVFHKLIENYEAARQDDALAPGDGFLRTWSLDFEAPKLV